MKKKEFNMKKLIEMILNRINMLGFRMLNSRQKMDIVQYCIENNVTIEEMNLFIETYRGKNGDS